MAPSKTARERYTSAKKSGGNPVLWMIVGATLVYPQPHFPAGRQYGGAGHLPGHELHHLLRHPRHLRQLYLLCSAHHADGAGDEVG